MSITESFVKTQYGQISVLDSGGNGPVALLIHGNSACKEVFQKQMSSDLGKRFRLIAMDLPGHGKSEKGSPDIYSLPGYGKVALDVLEKLGIEKASVIGWSLGGHIAIDMLKSPKIKGILITGTPPIPLNPDGFKKGFKPFDCLHLLGQEKFTEAEADTFMKQGGIDTKAHPFIVEAALKTDGKARANLIASMSQGVGGNQKEIVEQSQKPIAIVAGSQDAGINNDYIEKEVSKNALWQRKVHLVEAGHAVFWEKPEKFNELVGNFLEETNPSKALTFSLIGITAAVAAIFRWWKG